MSIPIGFIWEVPDPVDRYSPFSVPTSVWVIEAYVQAYEPLSLVFPCRLSFPTVGPKIPSLPTLAPAPRCRLCDICYTELHTAVLIVQLVSAIYTKR